MNNLAEIEICAVIHSRLIRKSLAFDETKTFKGLITFFLMMTSRANQEHELTPVYYKAKNARTLWTKQFGLPGWQTKNLN